MPEVRWVSPLLRRLSRPVPTFPLQFKKCRACGSRETVARLAVAGEPFAPDGTFVSLEKKVTPLHDFAKISTPTIPVLVRHYDQCAKCGFDYCTRAEKTTMPTEVLMQLMGLRAQAEKGG